MEMEKNNLRFRLAEGLDLIDTNREKETIPMFVKNFEKELPGSKVIYITQTGSVLHGTNSGKSDSDYKGIYIPSLESVISENYDKVLNLKTNDSGLKNGSEDIDMELFSIQEFFKQASSMEANNVEILFSMNSESVLYETEYSKMIKEKAKMFISNDIQRIIGFAMNMAYKYSEKGDRLKEVQEVYDFFKSKELSNSALKKTTINEYADELVEFCKDKEYIDYKMAEATNGQEAMYLCVLNKMYIKTSKVGYVMKGIEGRLNSFGKRAQKAMDSDGTDLKAFAHAIRAIRQAKDILLKGELVYPIPYAAELKEIKYSKTLTKTELSNMVEEEYQDLLELKDKIGEGKKPDYQALEKLKVDIYKKFIFNNNNKERI